MAKLPKLHPKLKDNKKKSKNTPPLPETVEDFQAAGVAQEEAGEKWRGGDAKKSYRFFRRAMEQYESGLRKFPDSFDLAYNRARVQYMLTQHPKLKPELPLPLRPHLEFSLKLSREALRLNVTSAEAMFNTAQVLTSLAESIEDDIRCDQDSRPLLREAFELFESSLLLQEEQYAASRIQATTQDTEMFNAGDSEDPPKACIPLPEPPQDETWATVVEPVTIDDLLDTRLAQLQTITTLLGLVEIAEGQVLSGIDNHSLSHFATKLQVYLKEDNEREAEAAITKAAFMAAIADANFKAKTIDANTYENMLTEYFSSPKINNDPAGLCAKADALIAFDSSLRLAECDSANFCHSRWNALTAALRSLTHVSTLPTAEGPDIHISRGDVELLRFRLSRPPTCYQPAKLNADIVLKNAATYYRGANALAEQRGFREMAFEAKIKESLVAGLKFDPPMLLDSLHPFLDSDSGQRVLEEILSDGLATKSDFNGIRAFIRTDD